MYSLSAHPVASGLFTILSEKNSLSSALQSYFEMCNKLFRLYSVTF